MNIENTKELVIKLAVQLIEYNANVFFQDAPADFLESLERTVNPVAACHPGVIDFGNGGTRPGLYYHRENYIGTRKVLFQFNTDEDIAIFIGSCTRPVVTIKHGYLDVLYTEVSPKFKRGIMTGNYIDFITYMFNRDVMDNETYVRESNIDYLFKCAGKLYGDARGKLFLLKDAESEEDFYTSINTAYVECCNGIILKRDPQHVHSTDLASLVSKLPILCDIPSKVMHAIDVLKRWSKLVAEGKRLDGDVVTVLTAFTDLAAWVRVSYGNSFLEKYPEIPLTDLSKPVSLATPEEFTDDDLYSAQFSLIYQLLHRDKAVYLVGRVTEDFQQKLLTMLDEDYYRDKMQVTLKGVEVTAIVYHKRNKEEKVFFVFGSERVFREFYVGRRHAPDIRIDGDDVTAEDSFLCHIKQGDFSDFCVDLFGFYQDSEKAEQEFRKSMLLDSRVGHYVRRIAAHHKTVSLITASDYDKQFYPILCTHLYHMFYNMFEAYCYKAGIERDSFDKMAEQIFDSKHAGKAIKVTRLGVYDKWKNALDAAASFEYNTTYLVIKEALCLFTEIADKMRDQFGIEIIAEA